MTPIAEARSAAGLESTDCPNCGAAERATLFEIEGYLYGVEGRFAVQRCGNCSLVYLSPRPARAAIGRWPRPATRPIARYIQDERNGHALDAPAQAGQTAGRR